MVYFIILFLFISQCTQPPRMVRQYDYNMPKDNVLAQCKAVLETLDYEIDIYAPESNALITKSINFRSILRRYNYLIYIQVTDNVDVYISAERSIVNRLLKSNLEGAGIIIQQPENAMPYGIQKRIFTPIEKGLKRKKIKRIRMLR